MTENGAEASAPRVAGPDAREGLHPTALPNPYRTLRNWGDDPPGRAWGRVSAVALDLDGRHQGTAGEGIVQDIGPETSTPGRWPWAG